MRSGAGSPTSKGLVSATRGNHGQSLAFAAGRAGLPVTIYVPRGQFGGEKCGRCERSEPELVEHGEDFQAAREEAIRVAQTGGLDLVPAFHPDLVLGVATYALELFGDQLDLRRPLRSRSARGRASVVASPRAMRSASGRRL